MKKDYTHISVILDRSGSMESIREDVIGGFNAFLGEQRAAPSMATLTLVQFDTQNPYEVINNFQLLASIPLLTRETYVPRASTPLLDAIGRGVNDLDAVIGKMSEADRPEKVIFLIVTDGQENASREFRPEQIAQMISAHEEKDKWQFVYISADLAAVKDAESYGIDQARILAFDKDSAGTRNAFAAASRKSVNHRMRQHSAMAFDEDERAQQRAEGERKPKS